MVWFWVGRQENSKIWADMLAPSVSTMGVSSLSYCSLSNALLLYYPLQANMSFVFSRHLKGSLLSPFPQASPNEAYQPVTQSLLKTRPIAFPSFFFLYGPQIPHQPRLLLSTLSISNATPGGIVWQNCPPCRVPTPLQEQDKQQDSLAHSVPRRHCQSSISANLPTMAWRKDGK